jgi:hypothetical protein
MDHAPLAFFCFLLSTVDRVRGHPFAILRASSQLYISEEFARIGPWSDDPKRMPSEGGLCRHISLFVECFGSASFRNSERRGPTKKVRGLKTVPWGNRDSGGQQCLSRFIRSNSALNRLHIFSAFHHLYKDTRYSWILGLFIIWGFIRHNFSNCRTRRISNGILYCKLSDNILLF